MYGSLSQFGHSTCQFDSESSQALRSFEVLGSRFCFVIEVQAVARLQVVFDLCIPADTTPRPSR